MAMVGPPSWLESCANAVGSQLKNPVRPRWCCARPLLCCCFGTGRATWTRTEVGTICQSYYLGFGAGNAAEIATELKEDEEPAADRVWGTGGRELAGAGGFTACVDGRLSQQRASPHCWMLVCRVCCRLLGTMSECFACSVITLHAVSHAMVGGGLRSPRRFTAARLAMGCEGGRAFTLGSVV